MIVLVKVVLCFPNNKPWISCDIKGLLNQKKAAFRENDREKHKQIQRELKRRLKMARVDYKKKMETKLQHNDTREVWRGLKNITGYKLKNSQVTAGDVDKANEFNLFYNRFNTATTTSIPSSSPPFFLVDEVRMELRRLRPGKAAGPGDVCPRLLKVCTNQLAEPLQRLFNLSLQEGRVPVLENIMSCVSSQGWTPGQTQ